MIASPVRYSALCALVLGGLAALAAQGTTLGLLPALLLVPLVAWPAWLALAYAAAVRRAEARAVLREGTSPWWTMFLGGALLRQIAAVPVALLAAWSVGWWLLAEGAQGLAWMGAAACLLYAVARLLVPQTRDLKPFARLRPILLLAPPLTAALLTLAWVLVAGLGPPSGGSLAERVAAEPRYEGSSALLAAAVDGMAVLSGARVWGLAWAEGRAEPLVTLWRLGAAFGQFWLLLGVLAGLLLPAGEARRILRPSDADRAPPAGSGRSALAAFLLVLVSGALVSLTAEGEALAGAGRGPVALAEAPGLAGPDGATLRPGLTAASDPGPTRVAPGLALPTALREEVEAERIGALACPPGTIAAIEALDRGLRNLLATRRAEVEQAVHMGFDAARGRVPTFLDGYYSLTAEYLRTFHLVSGDADDFLRGQLTETLDMDGAFARFRVAADALGAPLPADTLGLRDRLLAECGRLPPDRAVLRITAAAPEALLEWGPDVDAIAFEARLAASGLGGVAGGVAGTIAGKVIAKLVASEVFALAAETVAKLALGKAAGGLGGVTAGAGAGALAGSVVPGVGTTVGAVVGGVLGGLAVAVATDYALLEIEEAVSREAFGAEILASLDAAEAELLASLFPPD